MFSLFFYLLSSSICILTANLIKSDKNKIIDIIHYNIPPLRQMKYLSDALVLIYVSYTMLFLETELLSQFFLIMGTVQCFRSICSISTVLPPLKKYNDKYRFGGINGTGTEYIFSGHASYCALCTIYLYEKGINPFQLLLYNLFSQSSIIISRNHYTVDVVLAWIITPLVWKNIDFCMSSIDCKSNIKFLL